MDFITLYTDASFQDKTGIAKIAFRGTCRLGNIENVKEISAIHSTEAEMLAILWAIEEANLKFPNLLGFFVNSDNLHCVQSFWSFRPIKVNKECRPHLKKILKIVGQRWLRTKHVKAHVQVRDTRSFLNNYVDLMTKGRIDPKK